jgi:GntR family transcriptional regulator/MocR family aminotransferase
VDLFPVRIWAQLAARRLRAVTSAQLDYGESGGIRALREAIAAHVQIARGTVCDADQVVIVAGAQQGLDLACRLLLDPGDRAWMEDPGYPGARSALVGAGARILPVRVDAEGLDVEAGVRGAGDARLVYVTPSHQYPLGVPMSLPRRLALLRWASRARAWVIEDDYDSEFRYGARPIPCLHGLDVDGRVIYVGSFSKTLFPALRLGFVIVPPDLQDRLVAARAAADQHPPVLDQTVLADFITGGHFARHIRRMRERYRERLEAVAAAATRFCGSALRLRPVQTGLHVVADLDGADAVAVSREALARGVEVAPLSAYYARRRHAANALVLGFAAARPEAAARAMERVAAAIEAARRS